MKKIVILVRVRTNVSLHHQINDLDKYSLLYFIIGKNSS